MAKKLYVGNLNYDTTEEDLRGLFAAYGTVESLNLIMDRNTGRPKGFGFVEMSSEQEAEAAISGLNERDVDGRQIKVNIANDRPPRQGGRW